MPDQDSNIPSKLPTIRIAYDQAVKSPVYRLSELMFGSLLASYVLGFTGFLAIAAAESRTPEGHSMAAPIVQYTSISITYSYLTASLYMQYHAGILTMPHMPLKRLGFDFLLALATAVLFGFSMIYPATFPSLVGAVLIFSFLRQLRESKRLVDRLWEDIGGQVEPRDPKELRALRAVREKFAELLRNKDYEDLSVWKPVGMNLWSLALVLVLAGLLVWFMDMQDIRSKIQVFGDWHLPGWAVPTESGVVAVVVFIYGNIILRARATFLYDREAPTSEMDTRFTTLRETLRRTKDDAYKRKTNSNS